MTETSPERDDLFLPRLLLIGLIALVALGLVSALVLNRTRIVGVPMAGYPTLAPAPTDRPSGLVPSGASGPVAAKPPPQPALPPGAVPGAAPAAPKAQAPAPAPAAVPQPVNPDPSGAAEAAAAGNQASQRQDYDTAIKQFTRAIELNPAPVFFGLRGDIYWRQGNFDAALADYSQAIAMAPTEADNYFGRARVWRDKGDKAAAVADLQQFLQYKPDDNVNASIRKQAQDLINELR